MPLTVVESLIQRTRPWITVPVPSVTISESTPKITITAPFTNPASRAARRPAAMAAPIDHPWLTFKMPITMAVRVATDATDMS